MTALVGVWQFTHHSKLLKVRSTVSLASCKGALTPSVRLSFNFFRLASIRKLYSPKCKVLSHFHLLLIATLRFLKIDGMNHQPSVPKTDALH